MTLLLAVSMLAVTSCGAHPRGPVGPGDSEVPEVAAGSETQHEAVASAAPEAQREPASCEAPVEEGAFVGSDCIAWTPIDSGGGLVIDLPITEEEVERVEWVASYEFAPEEWGSSALAVEGEIVFLNLQRAPPDVGPLRAGWIATFMDGEQNPGNEMARTRLRALCDSNFVELRVLTYGHREDLAVLDGLACPHSLTLDGSRTRPTPSLEPLTEMHQLRYLGFLDRAPPPADLAVLRSLENLSVIGIDADMTVCELDAVRRQLPSVLVRHVRTALPCR